MANDKRYYWIVERGTVDQPPQNDPILVDDQGREVDLTNPATFTKATNSLKKVDHHRIYIEIKDFPNAALRFAPDKDDVLWTKKGGGAGNCPTTACHELKYEMWVDDPMHPLGKRIEIINMNLEPQDFWFTLNLVDKNLSGPLIPVDPPGGNQNGGAAGSIFSFRSSAAGAVTGLVVGFGVLAATVGFDAPNLWAFGLLGGLAGAIIGFAFDRFQA